jgi:hypothetical protein
MGAKPKNSSKKVKKCSKCKETKSVSCFTKCSSKKDGLNSWCKDCISEKHYKNYIPRKHNKEHKSIKKELTLQRHLKKLYLYIERRVNNSKRYENFTINFTREQFIKKFEKDADYLRIFGKWEKSGFHNAYAPSVDRIDSSIKKYSLDNIRIITKTKNSRRVNEKEGNFLGVFEYANASGKYKAAVKHLNVCISLGTYDTKEHAAIAVNMLWDVLEADEDLVIYNKVPKKHYKTFKPNKTLTSVLKFLEEHKEEYAGPRFDK